MQNIPFVKKFITCALAGLAIGATTLRAGFTFFRFWIPIGLFSIIPFALVSAAVIYAIIWQIRKTNKPATLAFWQGLIRYGVAFDLATFAWEKICHLQLVMNPNKLNIPLRDLSPNDLFWAFFSYSYPLACIIAAFQLAGAILLLFHRTRLAGVFVLLPVLSNILLMDIFYHIGISVVVHASIMLAGLLYFLFIEYNRLKEFFFATKNQLPSLQLSKYFKIAIRLSIIYIPLLLIAMRKMHNDQQHKTKQEVSQIKKN